METNETRGESSEIPDLIPAAMEAVLRKLGELIQRSQGRPINDHSANRYFLEAKALKERCAAELNPRDLAKVHDFCAEMEKPPMIRAYEQAQREQEAREKALGETTPEFIKEIMRKNQK